MRSSEEEKNWGFRKRNRGFLFFSPYSLVFLIIIFFFLSLIFVFLVPCLLVSSSCIKLKVYLEGGCWFFRLHYCWVTFRLPYFAPLLPIVRVILGEKIVTWLLMRILPFSSLVIFLLFYLYYYSSPVLSFLFFFPSC